MSGSRDLAGAVVVITGASSGIGRATALAFADQGARLVLASRGPEALDDVTRDCRARGAHALAVPADISDPADVEELGRRAVAEFGRVDVWVQAAAVTIAGPFGSEPVAEVRRLVDTNVLGNVLVARTALTTFEAQGDGVLIVVGSLLGLFPNPLVPIYSMSKYATRGLALNLQQAVAGRPGVEVCLVQPGPVDTPLFRRSANHTGRELRAIPPAAAPERLAATIVACARRPRRHATSGVVGHLAVVAHRLAPRGTEWLVARWSAGTITRTVPATETSGALFAPPPTGSVHGGYRRGRLRRRLGERLGESLARRPAGGPFARARD
jgi:NAD(P)-dependent dehydrogenase (short-subunit alcohol dehydrogenase family)